MSVAPAPGAGRWPRVAVGGVVVSEGRLLLVQRGHAPQAGRWTVPGGRVEWGETLAQAVEREVAEETGLTVRCGELLGWVERWGEGHHFVILDFLVTLQGENDPVAGSDAGAVAWVPVAAVGELGLAEGLHEFLRDHGVVP